jgi:hypothetical protein
MTLILGTVANGIAPHVVVSADGLSLARKGNREFVCSGTAQKVWLFPHAKGVVAHFGQNKFWNEETRCWHDIGEELRRASEDKSLTQGGDLTSKLAKALTAPVETTIKRPDSTFRFAVWVATIDGSRQAVIDELCWERRNDDIVLKRTSFGEKGKGTVAAAGDGHEIVQPLLSERIDGRYDFERLADEDLPYALEYHRRFLLAALLEQSRQGKTVFGGKFHTVAISADDSQAVMLDLYNGLDNGTENR